MRSGRPQRVIRMQANVLAGAENGRVVFDLPKDFDLTSLMVRITATANVTTLATAVRAEAALNLARYLTVRANGKEILDAVPGSVAHRLGMLRNGNLTSFTNPSGVAVASYATEAAFILDRALIDGVRPKDGNFPTRNLASFQLEVQVGAYADLFVGGAGNLSAISVEISMIKTEEILGADKKFSLPIMITRRTSQDLADVTATSVNKQYRLNVGNALRALLIKTTGPTTAGEPSNSVITNVRVRRGNEILYDLPATHIRYFNTADIDVPTVPTGYYLIDFASVGGKNVKINDCLDLSKTNEAFVELSITGNANNAINLTQVEYVPFVPSDWVRDPV